MTKRFRRLYRTLTPGRQRELLVTLLLMLERAQEAARIAQADNFIVALPDGFGSKVGECGTRLSGGQRQRLGIARALYRQRPVIILDEATNALNRRTEAAVVKSLAGRGLTVIMVAHRETSLQFCDWVIALDGGSAAEPDPIVRRAPAAGSRK